MQPNFLVIILAGLIPMAVGFVWYGKYGVGNAWIKESGVDMEAGKSQNMVILFGVSVLFSIMLAGGLLPAVIHQMGLHSMLMDTPELKDPNSALSHTVADLMDKYGSNYRTFKHGALHGVMTSIFVVLPVVGMNALFEQRSFKYIGIHVGYWAICMALMGGVICAYA
jgi:hypothetical protein